MDSCSFCGCGIQHPLQEVEIDGEILKICGDCWEKESDIGDIY